MKYSENNIMILSNKFLLPYNALSAKAIDIFIFIKKCDLGCDFADLIAHFSQESLSTLIDCLDFLYIINMIELKEGKFVCLQH